MCVDVYGPVDSDALLLFFFSSHGSFIENNCPKGRQRKL